MKDEFEKGFAALTGCTFKDVTKVGYSDEEVKEAINGLGEFLDWARAQHLVSENSAWKESAKLIWAAEQYLKQSDTAKTLRLKEAMEKYQQLFNKRPEVLRLTKEQFDKHCLENFGIKIEVVNN